MFWGSANRPSTAARCSRRSEELRITEISTLNLSFAQCSVKIDKIDILIRPTLSQSKKSEDATVQRLQGRFINVEPLISSENLSKVQNLNFS